MFDSDWHPGAGDSLRPPGFKRLQPIPDSPIYQQRHPTRYNLRPDVAQMARKVYRKFGGPRKLHINTYFDHPEGYWRTRDSFDVWGPDGRNDWLNQQLGASILDFLFEYPGLPDIEWVIYRRRWWLRSRGTWEPFGDGPFTWHDDHVHCTYLR